MLHIILILASLISFWIIGIVVFGLLPPIGCTLNTDRIALINTFAVDASLTVLGSILFYYLLVYIPQWRRQRVLFRLVEGPLTIVCSQMEIILLYIISFRTKRKSNIIPRNLKMSDFEGIKSISRDEIKFAYLEEGSVSTPCFDGSTELGFINEHTERIKQLTDLKDNPIYLLQTDRILQLVKRINSNPFISDIGMLYANTLPISIDSIDRNLYNFYQSYLALSEIVKTRPIATAEQRSPGTIPIIYT